MYLARRFPQCQLWWPSIGEDISVESLPGRPGKSVLLEVKTTDWNRSRWEHRLTIDVDQLRAYQRSPIPVYYVMPMPPWQDVLTDGHSWLTGRPCSDLLNPGHRWFGSWVFVARAQALWTWLGWRRSQKTATLFSNSGGATDPSTIRPALQPWWTWSNFWDSLARCGSSEMPSLFSVPKTSGDSKGWRSRQALVRRLSGLDIESDVRTDWELERFVPVEDEGYQDLTLDFPEITLPASAAGRSTALVHLNSADLHL